MCYPNCNTSTVSDMNLTKITNNCARSYYQTYSDTSLIIRKILAIESTFISA